MPVLHLAVATTIAIFAPQDCTDWHACRDEAVAAGSREDYEACHDLAWRAVQKEPKNDPELMVLLARAQSLSGRPGDALVMLGRLADLGVPTDALTRDDFKTVRLIPGWPALEPRLAGKPAPPEPVPVGAVREPPTPSPALSPPAPLT